jgi:hypothetical protein
MVATCHLAFVPFVPLVPPTCCLLLGGNRVILGVRRVERYLFRWNDC